MSKSQFKPAWWLPNSHLQTLWPAICRRALNLPLVRERIDLPDGDFIDLDWVKNNKKVEKIVIVLHGLEGSIDSHYARGMLKSIHDNGWQGLFMHFRGCSGEPNRFAKDYHSGETNDLQYVVEILKKRYPQVIIGAVGYSLGGNVLLKWLGQTGNANPLRAATAISVPFELHKAASRMQKGFSRFYQWYFIRCLRGRLSSKFKVIESPLDGDLFDQIKTMMDFDDKITAPLHGFSGADEYYTTSSSRQYLRTIETPTLILHAKDDPFMSNDVIPDHQELSPKIVLEISESGGHVGFVAGNAPWRAEYWLERRVPAFFKEHLDK